MVSCKLIPISCLVEVLLNKDTDFVIVTHGKLAGGKLSIGGLLSVLEGELLVLLEDALVAKQEPSAHSKGSLGIALVGREAIIVDGVGGIKFAAKLAQLISLAHFVLCFGETQVGCLFNVHH
jgi:hypothetical protein